MGNGKLFGKAIMHDQEYGSTILSLEGTLNNLEADLHLRDFIGWAPLIALYGNLKLTFTNDFNEAEGTWKTDIETQGTCKFWPKKMRPVLWRIYLLINGLRIAVRQYFAPLYLIFLLIIAILAVGGIIEVSWQALVLLLIPAPYLFRKQSIELIQALKVRKLGPVELEQGPVTDEIRLLIARQVQETVAFVLLDGFFVPRTKAMLLWLVQNERVDRTQFNTSTIHWRATRQSRRYVERTLTVRLCPIRRWTTVSNTAGPTIRSLSEREKIIERS
jgi:hypothetical protein